jgi:hypothetical protein
MAFSLPEGQGVTRTLAYVGRGDSPGRRRSVLIVTGLVLADGGNCRAGSGLG